MVFNEGIKMQLSEEQSAVWRKAILRLKNQGNFFLGGYAGTGKTTLAQAICEEFHNVAYCAFMGKAVNVMRRKGMEGATTLHRLLYDWDDDMEIFRPKPNINAEYVCLDEGSTVNTELWQDLQRHEIPTLVMGDPGQLEPVGKDAGLMNNPDAVLTRIFRNEGSISWYAEHVRQGGDIEVGTYGDVVVRSKESFKIDDLDSRFICGFNKTRVAVNKAKRKALGYSGDLVEGEQLICLHNSQGLFNGQLFTVKKILEEVGRCYWCDVILDDGSEVRKKVWTGALGCIRPPDWRTFPRRAVICDYAYAITCHKMIGSEEENVVVWDEQCDLWSPIRWRYTAITRASRKVVVYI